MAGRPVEQNPLDLVVAARPTPLTVNELAVGTAGRGPRTVAGRPDQRPPVVINWSRRGGRAGRGEFLFTSLDRSDRFGAKPTRPPGGPPVASARLDRPEPTGSGPLPRRTPFGPEFHKSTDPWGLDRTPLSLHGPNNWLRTGPWSVRPSIFRSHPDRPGQLAEERTPAAPALANCSAEAHPGSTLPSGPEFPPKVHRPPRGLTNWSTTDGGDGRPRRSPHQGSPGSS